MAFEVLTYAVVQIELDDPEAFDMVKERAFKEVLLTIWLFI